MNPVRGRGRDQTGVIVICNNLRVKILMQECGGQPRPASNVMKLSFSQNLLLGLLLLQLQGGKFTSV